jgi:hypothetical protein
MRQDNQDESLGIQNKIEGGENQVARTININNYYISSASSAEEIAKLVNQEAQAEERKDFKKSAEFQQGTEKINEDLKSIEKQSPDKNRSSIVFQECVREIDFDEAKDIFDGILKKIRGKHGAVLLLMHESESKRGDIYLEIITDKLKELKTDFKPYSIGLSSDCLLDEEGLLNKIASYFHISERDNRQTTIEKIITTICDSIRHGTILFFHLSQWDELANPSQTLIWFIEDFWKPLLSNVFSICKNNKYRPVKIVTVIDSPGILDLEQDCWQLPCICRFNPNQFNAQEITGEEVIEIPLRHWKQEEIDEWLAVHTKIEDNEKIVKQAQLIYRRNNRGEPQTTYKALKKIWLKNCPINLFNEAG